MRDLNYSLKPFLGQGLANKNNPRNNPLLIESIGTFPDNGVLKAVEALTRLDTTSLGTVAFPFPQIFLLSEFIIVCTENKIYEYAGGSFTLKKAGIAGDLWDILDFKSFLFLVNGECAIRRNSQTGVYEHVLPFAKCACNYNGQVIIGSPNENNPYHWDNPAITWDSGIDWDIAPETL